MIAELVQNLIDQGYMFTLENGGVRVHPTPPADILANLRQHKDELSQLVQGSRIPSETGSASTISTEPKVEPSPMTNARPVATDDAIFLYRHAVNLICRIAEDSPAYARLVAAFDAGDGFGFDDDLGETFLACLALCDAETRGDFSDYAELLEERLAIRAESRPGTSNNVKPSMAA